MSSTSEFRDDPASLERNSDAIRADMSATLNELGRRLSPGELIDRSAGYLRDNGGEFASRLGRQVKENPIPVALTAIGLVWLIAGQGRSKHQSATEYYGTDDMTSEDYASATVTPNVAGGDTGSTSTGKVSRAKQKVQQTAAQVKQRARTAAHATRGQAAHAKDSLQTMAENQPLALGAIGVAIGAIIGAALPGTQREDRLLGRARERTMERAKELGTEQYAHLRERAVTAAERAKDAAKESFLGENKGASSSAEFPRDEGAFRGGSTPVGRA